MRYLGEDKKAVGDWKNKRAALPSHGMMVAAENMEDEDEEASIVKVSSLPLCARPVNTELSELSI